jgi:peptide/nickel transport system ATP-binding protein
VRKPLLSVENLRVQFPTYAGVVRAVNGVSLRVEHGEIYGLVGETGCGKTVTGLSILRLLPPLGEITCGTITIQDLDIMSLDDAAMNRIRGGRVAMIFQDPSASLNPVFSIGEQISLVIRSHQEVGRRESYEQVLAMLETVGLPDPAHTARAYPHELSGGMQQRVMIALALCSNPELLVADEPTTALDVTIQAQILELLARLREDRGLAILLITHNLGIVAEICDRVSVLYAGHVVEEGAVRDIFKSMRHPYTRGLLAALPHPGTHGTTLPAIPGSVPSLRDTHTGCPFHQRCPSPLDICPIEAPSLRSWNAGRPDHKVACHLLSEESLE